MNIPCTRNALGLVVFWVAAPAFGITSIASIEPTQMQAKITVLTDQAGFCTYRASRGAVFNSNIPDLVDNSNTDARAGSVVNGNRHVFILGTRKANDALAAAAIYWTGVTCGSDSEVSAAFATRPIPWGNTAPDILPFKSSALLATWTIPSSIGTVPQRRTRSAIRRPIPTAIQILASNIGWRRSPAGITTMASPMQRARGHGFNLPSM